MPDAVRREARPPGRGYRPHQSPAGPGDRRIAAPGRCRGRTGDLDGLDFPWPGINGKCETASRADHHCNLPERQPRVEDRRRVLVTLAAFTRPWEAHLLRGRLEAEGISAFVAHEQHVSMDWPITLALGGVRVQVPAEDLDRARGVVLRVESGVYASELADQFGDLGETRCPACGSGDFDTRATAREIFFLLVSFVMVGAPYRIRGSVHRCNACGARWSD